MPKVMFPYGHGRMEYEFPEEGFLGSLVPPLHSYVSKGTPQELVERAVRIPVGCPPLHVLAQGKRRVVILVSDHTRPVPSRLILPVLLAEIRKGAPKAQITILVATGCHRATTEEELRKKLGPELAGQARVLVHDCDGPVADCGYLPSGGRLLLNKTALEADLLVAEGFIEPHFFAGFSGGRKSVLPGIAGRRTVLYNHNAGFIAHPYARAGNLLGNPVHADMLYAARTAQLAFICNVVLGPERNVVYATAGDCVLAHEEGCAFVHKWCSVPRVEADIVVTSNGGYPLDQNVYQAVKGLSTAREAVKKGGSIVMLAQAADGHGGKSFFADFVRTRDLARMEETIVRTRPEDTRPDQWQCQILLRVLRHARVIFVSALPPELVRAFHMVPASSLEEAMILARRYAGSQLPTVAAIPDGVGTILR